MVELNEKEKFVLFQCEDGLGFVGLLYNEKLNLSQKEGEKILKRLLKLGLVTFDPYKEKDLKIYRGLRTKKEMEDFKKRNPPSYYPTEKGRRLLTYSSEWE